MVSKRKVSLWRSVGPGSVSGLSQFRKDNPGTAKTPPGMEPLEPRVLFNAAPFAEPDAVTIAINAGEVAIDVTANDTDADGDTLAADAITLQPGAGTARIENGTVFYTAPVNFVGDDPFIVQIADPSGATDSATLTVTVVGQPPNTAPFAAQDNLTIVNDNAAPVLLDVLANDTDADGDALSIVSVDPPGAGLADVVGNQVRYTPPLGFTGNDAFTYTITDGHGGTDLAYVVLNIQPGAGANLNPFAGEDHITLANNGVAVTLDLLANDSDADGDPLSVASVGVARNGTVELLNGVVRYTPDAGFAGQDHFVYTLSDGQGGTDSAHAILTVTPGTTNTNPYAEPDTVAVPRDAVDFVIDVTLNDTDADGDALTAFAIALAPGEGTARIENGHVLYTPPAGFVGDDPFIVQITDGNGGFDTATVHVSVQPPANAAPTAASDTAQTEQDSAPLAINVLANDTDPDGDPLTITAVTQGAHGSVATDGSTVTYTAAAGYSGPDAFTYTITDGQNHFATGNVAVTVTPVNRGTLALGASSYTVDEDASTIDVTVTRTGGSDGAVDADFTTVDGSATAPGDYQFNSGTVFFADGQTAATITLFINNDALSEGDENFAISLDRVGGGAALGAPRTALIHITDDDAPPVPGNGALGEYFDDRNLTDLVLRRTDPAVNFDWATGSPDPLVAPDTFSVRWTAELLPAFTETYTFRTYSDDGVRLWVDGQLLIDQWNDHPPTSHTATIALVAGQRVNLKMEMYEKAGNAVAQLFWSSASVAEQLVPAAALYSPDPEPVNNPDPLAGETVVSGLTMPTAIDFTADGTMFIGQKNGVVRVFKNGQLLATPFIDISTRVNDTRDRGMLGLAVHPDFANNPYVYLLYTYDPPETQGQTGLAAPDQNGNRAGQLLRVTADPATGFTTALPGSETVILGRNSTWDNISSPDKDSTGDFTIPPSGFDENGVPIDDFIATDSQSHTVGALDFGLDGALYVSIGDGASYGNVDPRADRVQSIDNLSGKLLRIDPITGDGLADNPFYNGDPNANRSKVFSYGLRNPFRVAINPTTGVPYIGDVGWTQWEEINASLGGENFGWPYYEGGNGQNLQTGGYQDLHEAIAFYASNPDATAPLWSRSHTDGGRAIVVGDFMVGSAYAGYQDALFFTDYGDPAIKALLFLPDGTVDRVVTAGPSVGFVVEMTLGNDGLMYYVDLLGGKIGRFTQP